MPTPTQCLALHLGDWQGIFTEWDPLTWTVRSQKRSLIQFEQLPNGAIQQSNAYFGMDEVVQPDPTRTQSWIYQDFSPGLRFFADGSFSNGRVQLAPASDFGAEQGFLLGDGKRRVVTLFNREGQLTAVTTIDEVRGTWQEQPQDQLLESELQGSWRGTCISYQADAYTSESQPWEGNQGLCLANFTPLPGRMWIGGHLLLPVLQSHRQRQFELQVGWLPRPGQALSLIRRYDSGGALAEVTLLQVERMG